MSCGLAVFSFGKLPRKRKSRSSGQGLALTACLAITPVCSDRANLATEIVAKAQEKLDVLTGQVHRESNGPTHAVVALSV